MERRSLTAEERKSLVVAGVLETVCIGGGVAGLLMTGNVIWLVIGVVAGLGFSLPAVIKLVRGRREQDRASR